MPKPFCVRAAAWGIAVSAGLLCPMAGSMCPMAGAQDLNLRHFRMFESGQKSIYAFAVDSSERLLAVGGADSNVTVFDLATSRQIRQWQLSQSAVVDLAFAAGRPLLASASYPNSLTLFDVEKGEQVWQTKCVSPPTRIAFSPDGKKIGVASMVGRGMIYDADDGSLLVGIKQSEPASNGVAFSLDGSEVFIGTTPMSGKSGQVRILRCSAATGNVVREIGGYDGTLTRLRVSPGGSRLVSLGREGKLNAWDLAGDRLAQGWNLDVQRLMQVGFLDDDTLVAGSLNQFQILEVGKPDAIRVVEQTGGVNHVAPLPKRGLFAAAVQGTVHLFTFDKTALNRVAADVKPVAAPAPMPEPEVVFDKTDNQPPRGVQVDGVLSAEDATSLIGKPLALKLKSGLLVVNAELESMQFDRGGHGLRFLKYRLDSGRSVTVRAADIYAMRVGPGSYALRYYPPRSQLYLFDMREANQVASGRLAASNRQLRASTDDDAQTEATNEHKKFLSDAARTLRDVGDFRIDETESTLIFTDLPEAAIAPLRRYVDAMNEQLNRVFGIPKGDSVWRGKAVLAVFGNVSKFAAFEEKVMNNPNHGGRGGVREGAKRFLQTAIVKKVDPGIARALCWGYTLGFTKRLYSDAQGTPWLNMGIANAMQFAIVPDVKMQNSQHDRVVRQLERDGSLLGLLRATKLEQDRWPTCGQLVRFLVARDAIAFGQMFRDVKLGIEIEDALRQNYAMGFNELAASFGASMGVPLLTP